MTQYLFRNAGVIDPRAITTFGVSSKEGKNPIGFFGTGLKYAIAVLLRNDCSITIHSGTDTYEFGVESTRIRVNDFNVVTMNGTPLGFTTELGKTWEMWQAFRELACNAIDEGGEYTRDDSGSHLIAEDHETVIVVKGSAFDSAWEQRNSIFLKGTPLVSGDMAEIYRGRSEWLYYRGVRAYKLDKPSNYTYNVTTRCELTEDRTLKSLFFPMSYISLTIANDTRDKKLLEDILTADKETMESSLSFSLSSPSAEFVEVVSRLIKKFNHSLNLSAKALVKKNNIADVVGTESIKLSAIDVQKMDRATGFLKAIGYEVSEYPIIVTEFLGDSVLGAAENDKIYISRRCLMMGTKMLAGTILEEYLHLKHHVRDETRQMQNFLLDALISLGEQVTGVSL